MFILKCIFLVTPCYHVLLPRRTVTFFQLLPTTLSIKNPQFPECAPSRLLCSNCWGTSPISTPILHPRSHQCPHAVHHCRYPFELQTTTWPLKMPHKLGVMAPTKMCQVGVKQNQRFHVLKIILHVCPRNAEQLRVWHTSSTIRSQI